MTSSASIIIILLVAILYKLNNPEKRETERKQEDYSRHHSESAKTKLFDTWQANVGFMMCFPGGAFAWICVEYLNGCSFLSDETMIFVPIGFAWWTIIVTLFVWGFIRAHKENRIYLGKINWNK